MLEAEGNVWRYMPADARVVTTNAEVKAPTEHRPQVAVMGKGVALQAAMIHPDSAYRLAEYILRYGNRCFILGQPGDLNWRYPYALVTYPTKEMWLAPAIPALVQRSAKELAQMADKWGWQHVVLPRPGCGEGGLLWADVKALLAPVLDDRFTVLEYTGLRRG